MDGYCSTLHLFSLYLIWNQLRRIDIIVPLIWLRHLLNLTSI